MPFSMLSERFRDCRRGRAPEPHSAGSVPTRELFCSSRYCSWTMDEKDAGSVPAAQRVPQILAYSMSDPALQADCHASMSLAPPERLAFVAQRAFMLAI